MYEGKKTLLEAHQNFSLLIVRTTVFWNWVTE